MPTFDPPICPECGAQRVRQNGVCWLCGIDPKEFASHSQSAPKYAAGDQPFSFSLSSLLLIITLASVCFGIIAIARGLGIFLCLILVPVLVQTIKSVREREAAGEQVSVPTKIGLLLSSFGIAVVVLTLIAVAAFCTLCGACFTVFSLGSPTIETLGTGFLMITIGVGAIVLIILIRRKLGSLN